MTTVLAIDCRDCKHCGSDPDGLFCAHPTSFVERPIWGASIRSARADPKICPEARLFERASDAVLIARGRPPLCSICNLPFPEGAMFDPIFGPRGYCHAACFDQQQQAAK